jgi:hypothetical protein
VRFADLVEGPAVVGQEHDLDLARELLEHAQKEPSAFLVEMGDRIVEQEGKRLPGGKLPREGGPEPGERSRVPRLNDESGTLSRLPVPSVG